MANTMSMTARERAEEKGYTEIARILKQAEELGKAQEEGFAGITPDEVAKIVAAALDVAALLTRPTASGSHMGSLM